MMTLILRVVLALDARDVLLADAAEQISLMCRVLCALSAADVVERVDEAQVGKFLVLPVIAA